MTNLGAGRPTGENDTRLSWRRRFHGRQPDMLLIAMLLVIIAAPIDVYWPYGDLLLAPSVVLMVLAAAVHYQVGRRMVYVILALAIVWLTCLPGLDLFGIGDIGQHSLMLAITLATLVVIGRHIIGATEPDWGTVNAALSGYLVIGVFFGQIYALIFEFVPGAFLQTPTQELGKHFELYFSFTTLATVGYGDIVPVNPFARMLAVIEAVVGQFYIATAIARLVVLARPRSPR